MRLFFLAPSRLLPVAVLSVWSGSSVLAADLSASDGENKPRRLDPVTVTASRVESKVKETPSAVTVVERETLETVKFVDVRRELMKRVPGYSMVRNLRIPMGGKNYTVNLVDGLATGRRFGSGSIGFAEDTNTFDIERLEVIRGPASALYGSHALGGVINVITREPPAEPEYRLWAEGGEYSRFRGGLSAGGTVGEVGYFVDVNRLDSQGWQERTVYERDQFSAKLLFNPDPESEITLRTEYLDLYQENPGSLEQTDYDTNWQQAAVPDAYNDEQSTSGSIKYVRDLSAQSGFEISYGIRKNESEGPPSYNASGDFGSDEDLNQNMVAFYRHDFEAYRGQLVAGVDLLHSANKSKTHDGRTKNDPLTQELDLVAQGTSPFLQYEISPVERVRLSLGARHDHVHYSADGYDGSTNVDKSIDFSQLSPKAGATFELSAADSLWVSYGKGFVIPSIINLFVDGRYDANPDLKPERAEDYELGLRGNRLDGALSYDITLYHTDIQDMIVGDSALDLYVNAGKVRVRGVESTVGYQPWPHWRFDLTHTYADNQYIDFVSGTNDYSGNTLPSSPLHHFDFRVTWQPLPGLSTELEWNHISDYYTNNNNAADPMGRANRPDLFNLRLAYTQGPWSLWGTILNLTDEKYAERISYSEGRFYTGRKFDVGAPRTFYAGIAYTWGK